MSSSTGYPRDPFITTRLERTSSYHMTSLGPELAPTPAVHSALR